MNNQTNSNYEQAKELLAIYHKLGVPEAFIGIVQYHVGQQGPTARPAVPGEAGPLVIAYGDNNVDVAQTLAVAKGKHVSVRGFPMEHCLHAVYNFLTARTEREILTPAEFRLYVLSLLAPAQEAYQAALKTIVEGK